MKLMGGNYMKNLFKSLGVIVMDHKREIAAGLIAGTVAMNMFGEVLAAPLSDHEAMAIDSGHPVVTDTVKDDTVHSNAKAPEYTLDFWDIKTHWAHDSIMSAVKKGYVDGYQDGTFKPNQSISRMEFVKMIVAATAGPQVESGSNWYDSYLAKAKSDLIVKDGDFADGDVNKAMTRLELARTASRAIGKDTADMNKWMWLATSNGLIQGMTDWGTLAPEEVTTRAQAITIIERILAVRKGDKLPLDKYAMSAAEVVWHRTNVITMLPQYFKKGDNSGQEMGNNFRFNAYSGYLEVEKYVVVDLDDPKDPNRNLIGKDWVWNSLKTSKGSFSFTTPSNAYALVSVTHINLTLEKEMSRGILALPTVDFNGLTKLAKTPVVSNTDITLVGMGRYGAVGFVENGIVRTNYVDNTPPLSAGHHDETFVSAKLIPKGEYANQGEQVSLSRTSAVEFGESTAPRLYSSWADYSIEGWNFK
jgi:hypothetical protein